MKTRPPARRHDRRSVSSPLVALILAVAALATLGPAPASAQVHEHAQPTGRELQLPIDAAFLEITPQVRRQLGLFAEVEDFASARLFLLEDGSYILEVAALRDGRIERTRTPMTEYDLGLFRAEIEARLETRGAALVLNREGRGGLVLRHTLLGVAFYGWAMPEILGLTGDRAQVATYLLTAGASFYLPYRLTRHATVSDAHRSYALWGGTRGIVHGVLLGGILTGPDTRDGFGFEEDNDAYRVRLATAMAGSIAGAWLGFKAVDWREVDEGTTRLWGAMGDYGILAGLGTAHVLGLYDDEIVYPNSTDPFLQEERRAHLRLGHAVTLAGSAGGIYAGRWLAERESYTVGNVTALTSFGVLGVQAILPLVDAVTDDEKVGTAGALVGGTSGLYLGNRLLRRQAFSEGDGLLIAAGHVAGGLTAAGITYLIRGDAGGDSSLLYLTTSAIGSGLGFALTYRALDHRRGDAWQGEERSAPGSSHSGGGSAAGSARGTGFPGTGFRGSGVGILPGRNAHVTFSPAPALVALISGAGAARPEGNRAPARVPLVTVHF